MKADPDVLRSFERRGWVIPNGSGQLWTDRVFDTEGQARAYIDAAWRDAKWSHPKHRPALASVALTATVIVTPEATDAQ